MSDKLGEIVNKIDMRDVMIFAGIGFFCYGISMIYPPSGWIVAGAMLLHKSY